MIESTVHRAALAGIVMDAREWTPQQAASHVSEAWQNAVESIVETGRRLIEAKQRVGHGRWLEAVALMPFSERTAQALAQIARHPDLSNPQHVAGLPASWGTLAVLAQLPPGEVARRIEAGDITPELDRATAQQWTSTYAAARQEALNAYSAAVDGLTVALSWAKTYRPPADLPGNYVSVGEFVDRIAALAAQAGTWSE